LLKDNEIVEDIAKALERRNKRQLESEIRDSIIEQTREVMRESLRHEFINELNEYSNAVKKAEEIVNLNNQTTNWIVNQ
jgi:uncharacterized membrane protein YheB (UPF0754 family)